MRIKKNKLCGFILIFCFFALSMLVFTVSASAENSDEIRITSSRAILNGQSVQMEAKQGGDTILPSQWEWTSDDPYVIACTPSGKITGLKKGYAKITVKSKYGTAQDSVTVYCAEKSETVRREVSDKFLVFVSSTPNIFPIQNIVLNIPPFTDSITYTIRGVYGHYFYVEYSKGDTSYVGFLSQYFFPDSNTSSDVFNGISASQLNIFVDQTKTLTTNYSGSVKWSVSNSDIISYNSNTGEVYAKAPGIATISATANGKTFTCTVRSIYKWKKEWQGTANTQTYVYIANGNGYAKTGSLLSSNNKFTVKGDLGNSDGWAYGVSTSGVWGFVPIANISTKNTVSFYNNLNWSYPLQNTSYNYISSPYAPRDDSTSSTIHHRGMDITTGTPGEIKGADVVAAASGVVARIKGDDSDCGHCISIRTNIIDPVTNKNITIIYMHLYEVPKYQNEIPIQEGERITAGTIIGKVGKTNGGTNPDMGYHLHFEANNQGASVGDAGRSNFTYTLNPIYFYVNKAFRFNPQSNSYKNYGGYWYNY